MVGGILTLMGIGGRKNEGEEVFAAQFLAQGIDSLSYRSRHKKYSFSVNMYSFGCEVTKKIQ